MALRRRITTAHRDAADIDSRSRLRARDASASAAREQRGDRALNPSAIARIVTDGCCELRRSGVNWTQVERRDVLAALERQRTSANALRVRASGSSPGPRRSHPDRRARPAAPRESRFDRRHERVGSIIGSRARRRASVRPIVPRTGKAIPRAALDDSLRARLTARNATRSRARDSSDRPLDTQSRPQRAATSTTGRCATNAPRGTGAREHAPQSSTGSIDEASAHVVSNDVCTESLTYVI